MSEDGCSERLPFTRLNAADSREHHQAAGLMVCFTLTLPMRSLCYLAALLEPEIMGSAVRTQMATVCP